MPFNQSTTDQGGQKDSKLKSQTRKNPGIAAALSFFMPGLGQVYNGDILRAILGIFVILFGGAFMVAGIAFDAPVPLIIGALWLAIFWFGTVFDAHKTAIRINNELDTISKMNIKKCPFCAEMIQKEAIVCRYCNKSLGDPAQDKKKGSNEDPLGLLEKGQKAHGSGKYNEAIEAFSNAIISSPNYTTAFYSRGVSYSKIGDSKNAINDLKASAKLGHSKSQEFLKSKNIAW